MRRVLLLVVVALAVGCGGDDTVEPLVPTEGLRISEADLRAVTVADLAATEAGDDDAYRRVYSEDVVLIDGEDRLDGIDELVSTAEFIWTQWPDAGARIGEIYVGADDGVVTVPQWGFDGFTEASPYIEYRVLEVDNGIINAWEALYDLDTRPFFSLGGMDEEAASLLDSYLAAWNSADPTAIASLYDTAAVRHDPVFGSATGPEAIETVAETIFDRFDATTWDLIDPLAIRSHIRVGTGGVLSIVASTDPPCEVRAFVYIESPGERITRERVYFDVASLLVCGWAGDDG